jgi:hypothetical protein
MHRRSASLDEVTHIDAFKYLIVFLWRPTCHRRHGDGRHQWKNGNGSSEGSCHPKTFAEVLVNLFVCSFARAKKSQK